MKNIDRRDIHIFARNSSLSQKATQQSLEQEVYQHKKNWDDFFRFSLLILGLGFLCLGIIFFFAYNWQDLHKFVKMGIIQGLLLVAVSLILFLKTSETIKNIILTATAMLVGVLFAVFGQVYQTGANAYDFFLAWTVFIAIWTIISKFPPLWILFIALINTTFLLYFQQVTSDWSWIFAFSVLTILNSIPCMIAILWNLQHKNRQIPEYFIQITALATVVCATISMLNAIIENYPAATPLISILLIYLYSLGIIYGMKYRKIFFLTSISLSLMIIISTFLLHYSESEEMIFTIGLFNIIAVTVLVRFFISLQKKHSHE